MQRLKGHFGSGLPLRPWLSFAFVIVVGPELKSHARERNFGTFIRVPTYSTHRQQLASNVENAFSTVSTGLF